MKSVSPKQKHIVMGWYQDFVCPGGNCGLTCCSEEWDIELTEDEIERYRSDKHPYMKSLLEEIDFEKKRMKSGNGICNMLDEFGYCKLVRNCGDDYLSHTCKAFPRKSRVIADVAESWVEICCPLVAEKLIDNCKIDYIYLEADDKTEFETDEIQIYDLLASIRTRMVNIFSILPREYMYGKLFILSEVTLKMKEAISKQSFNNKTIDFLNNRMNDAYLEEVFLECEKYKDDLGKKTLFIHSMLSVLFDSEIFKFVYEEILDKIPYLDIYFKRWLENRYELEQDIKEYSLKLKLFSPDFNEIYFEYSLFTSWMVKDLSEFGLAIDGRIVELMLIQLAGIAEWKEFGIIDRKEFSKIIACIDRRIERTNMMKKEISRCFDSIIYDDILKRVFLVI